MIISVINQNHLRSLSLPEKIKGQFWLYETTDTGENKLATIEGTDNAWVLHANRQVKLFDAGHTAVNQAVLSEMGIYTLCKTNLEKVIVFAEPVTRNRAAFSKYLVPGECSVFIGRAEQNDICFACPFISANHLVLTYRNGSWFIQDNGSTNGTFVNGRRVSQQALSIGDLIFVMGLKIIVGQSMLAINNPDGNVSVSGKLMPYVKQPVLPADPQSDYAFELAEKPFFYRSPRFKREIETAKFQIDAPPASPVTDEMPWFLAMGSSIAMGMMSVVTLSTAIASANITSMIMGGSMLAGTVLMPTVTRMYGKNARKKKENLRQTKYRAYLAEMAGQINDACLLQKDILNENFEAIENCEVRILRTKRNLWDRELGQNDFLKIRIGHGNGLLDAEISCPEQRFTLDDDTLQQEMFALCKSEHILSDIPITLSLFDNYISGVIGPKDRIFEFAKGIILQLAALYSYDEVKFVFLFDEADRNRFGFVKWLPHVWNDDNKFRFIATNADELKEVSAYFEKVIDYRARLNDTDLKNERPYYILFSMSNALSKKAEMLKNLLGQSQNLHISVVTFSDSLRNLPKECSLVTELFEADENGKLFDKNDTSGKYTVFTPDIFLTHDPYDLSTVLANIKLDIAGSRYKLPNMLTFMDLFGVGNTEHLNVLTRWKENDPTKSLQAAVGVNTNGDPFLLDLHEKFHGPHGLIAGMTGSGKSEFIITYILSLAVNYHPHEVAFILIDYKGGGMAKSFENLPHTVGIITNLDGSAIKRSLVSIESELRRRQKIFAEVSKQIGVSNIDIYKYQKLYREGAVSEPLQHLFIISDEFAELKTQQPEFMAQLISAARIGRSLGVHLVLATQKPSGVVDDQIWSNSRFRVCLKVQERADSMDMLKRPDAAELTNTGRFYLQVGYNELFELGQSAWSGAPYCPTDHFVLPKDDSITVIDTNGHILKQVKPDKRGDAYRHAPKQLDAITEYLNEIAREEGIQTSPLWLPPLPAVILLDTLRQKYGTTAEKFVLRPIIGEYDDPARQRQNVLRLALSEEGNTLIYGASGSGKTTFLSTMIYSLIQEHTPEEVQLYLLDFASETLKAFAAAPHIGDVILAHEAEKVNNLFKMLLSEMQKRKKLFTDYGGDYASYIKLSGKTLPFLVVAIHNFAAFTENYEDKEEVIAHLSREGAKYGICFVLTALGTGAVRFRLLQNFPCQLALQLNDPSDYPTIVGKTDGLLPSKCKGRGLIRLDTLYEFQTAVITKEAAPAIFIQNACRKLAAEWTGETAPRVPILPERVTVDFLREYYLPKQPLSIPVGVETGSLNVHRFPFGESYINLILSAGTEYQGFVSDFITLFEACTAYDGIVLDAAGTIDADAGKLNVYTGSKALEEQVSLLFEAFRDKNNAYKEALERGETPEAYETFFVVIHSLAKLREGLSDLGKEKLSLILERGTIAYNMFILIADQAKNISSVSFEKWYTSQVSPSSGLWIGGGITEQYQMKPAKVTRDMYDDLTEEFGYALNRGRCCKLKFVNQKEDDEDES